MLFLLLLRMKSLIRMNNISGNMMLGRYVAHFTTHNLCPKKEHIDQSHSNFAFMALIAPPYGCNKSRSSGQIAPPKEPTIQPSHTNLTLLNSSVGPSSYSRHNNPSNCYLNSSLMGPSPALPPI